MEGGFRIPRIDDPGRLTFLKEALARLGAEAERHLATHPGGVPPKSCHECMRLTADVMDYRKLVEMQEEYEKNR